MDTCPFWTNEQKTDKMSENEQNVRKWTKMDKMDTCSFWKNE